MPTHDPHDEDRNPEEIDTSKGFEASDVRVSGVVIFLLSLCFFAGVTALLAYGIGKAINGRMAKEDGPPSKWSQSVDLRPLGEMPNNPEMQNKVAQMTENFPTPRVQTDDGNQDVADLHAREDLLLSNYSWADQSQGKVRIPIERAMELLAQRGLPVAPAAAQTPRMTGDEQPAIAMPLTDGFARTGYELDQAAPRAMHPQR